MCVDCNGLGTRVEFDTALVIPDESLTIDEGAVKPWGKEISEKQSWSGLRTQILQQLGVPFDVPFRKLSKQHRELVLRGAGERKFKVSWKGKAGGTAKFVMDWEGVLPRLMRRFRESTSESAKRWYAQLPRRRALLHLPRHAPAARERGRARRGQDDRRALLADDRRRARVLRVARAGRRGEADRRRAAQGDPQPARASSRRSGLGYLSLDRAGPSLSGGEIAADPPRARRSARS